MTEPGPFVGRVPYRSHEVIGGHRFLLAVWCFVGDTGEAAPALLDTGSEWCVLGSELVPSHGANFEADTLMLTRFGTLAGSLERLPLIFADGGGREVTIDATWFVSEEWPGPTVIGWRGALERIRFAVDPADESFYFGKL